MRMRAYPTRILYAALFVGLWCCIGGCSSSSNGSGGGGGGGTAGAGGQAGSAGAAGGGGTAGAGGVAGGGGSGCATNDDCDAADYCNLESCTPPGTCETRPINCPDIFMPVCGCDGETYSNGCDAAAAGVAVASEGECRCESNDDCVAADYCASDVSCNEPGECVVRPAHVPGGVRPGVRMRRCHLRKRMPGCERGCQGRVCWGVSVGARLTVRS